MSRIPTLLLTAAISAALPAPAAPPSPQVTIYRCTGPAGRLALRDSPCRAGEHQQVRSMLRPLDPPRRAALPVVRQRVGRETPAIPRVVYLTPPRPTYECTTPDGAHYASESPEGNPRWVPMWTLGYPAMIAGPYVDGGYVEGGYGGVVQYRHGGTTVQVGAGRRWQGPGLVTGGPAVYIPTGTWIRDTCQALPVAEACSRLRDRRDELDRRYTSALQSERQAIVQEERGIDARLAGECAG